MHSSSLLLTHPHLFIYTLTWSLISLYVIHICVYIFIDMHGCQLICVAQVHSICIAQISHHSFHIELQCSSVVRSFGLLFVVHFQYAVLCLGNNKHTHKYTHTHTGTHAQQTVGVQLIQQIVCSAQIATHTNMSTYTC